MTALSTHLRTAADNAHDGKIPSATLSFINQVAAAEREMARDLGKLESTFRTLKAAQDEVRDRYAELRLLERRFAGMDSDGAVTEMLARARADAIDAAEWEEQCGLAYRNALRQAAEDARQAAGAAQGAAA